MKTRNIKGQLSLPFPTRQALVRASDLRRWNREIEARMKKPLPRVSAAGAPIILGPGRHIDPAVFIRRIVSIVSRLADPYNAQLIHFAFRLAERGHNGQYRKSGEPFIEHPVSVAEIVAEWGRMTGGLGVEEICAALLHDTIEDGQISGGRITREYLEEIIGTRISEQVEGITELGKEPEFKGEKPSEIEIYTKLLEYGEQNIRNLIIKLADRLHNMRTLAYVKPEVQRAKAEETLYVYGEIANILGMWQLKRELQDLSYRYVDEANFKLIEAKKAQVIKASRQRVIQEAEKMRELLELSGLEAKVQLEERFIYELQERMQLRNLTTEELSSVDVWRVNIVVPAETDSYDVLGIVHKFYPPVQEEIRDFISEPKPNGHQFLQSYVKVPAFGRMLVQIRDRKMQKNYAYGILTKMEETELTWLKALLRYVKSAPSGEMGDLYDAIAKLSSPIWVYTSPLSGGGKRIQLPFGSTALDFARRINEDVFTHASDVVINNRSGHDLSHELQDGDRVFITIDPRVRPRLEWLDWIRTDEARTSLRRYLKKHPPDFKTIQEYLNKHTMRFFLNGGELLQTSYFAEFIKRRKGFRDENDLLEKIGRGLVDVDGLMSDFIEQMRADLRSEDAEHRLYGFSMMGKDRPGMLDDVAAGIRGQGINLAYGVFYKYLGEDGEEIGVVEPVAVGRAGTVGEVLQSMVRTIGKSIRGVEKSTTLSNRDVEELWQIVMERKKGKGKP